MRRGHEVLVPNLPNPEAPDPEEWTKALLDTVGAVDDQTIVVGHSLGATSALRLLEASEARSTVKGCILISPPWMIRHEKFRGFFFSDLDFDVLMWKSSLFTVIHSQDDEVIPYDHAEKYARLLQARLVERQSDGHFDGNKYPVILEEIERIVNTTIEYAPGQALPDEYDGIH